VPRAGHREDGGCGRRRLCAAHSRRPARHLVRVPALFNVFRCCLWLPVACFYVRLYCFRCPYCRVLQSCLLPALLTRLFLLRWPRTVSIVNMCLSATHAMRAFSEWCAVALRLIYRVSLVALFALAVTVAPFMLFSRISASIDLTRYRSRIAESAQRPVDAAHVAVRRTPRAPRRRSNASWTGERARAVGVCPGWRGGA
jgi:hypothetical protein